MTSQELREKFIEFFTARGHKVIPSASLVPEDDSTVLFTTAGMQQFKRFYLFPEEAPAAKIATIQKCIRTGDIDEVGDESHLTFFEMLGNFSFGYDRKFKNQNSKIKIQNQTPYFKEDAIKMAWEFLTGELKISKDRISFTYFKGEKDLPKDNESLEIIKKISGFSDDKIKGTGKNETFWSLGTEGSPGGPTVEFYVDEIEVWNLVFNEYVYKNGKFESSEYKGVDTGMGFERLLAVLNDKDDIYQTELFVPIIEKIEELSGKKYDVSSRHSEFISESQSDEIPKRVRDDVNSSTQNDNKVAFRIIADHIRASVFLLSEQLMPSNKDQGYILRRLIRRAVRYGKLIGLENFTSKLVDVICHSAFNAESIQIEKSILDSRLRGNDKMLNLDDIKKELDKEEERFNQNLENGLQKAEDIFKNKKPIDENDYSKIMQLENKGQVLKKIYGDFPDKKSLTEYGIRISDQEVKEAYITGKEAFDLYQSYGFPKEMIKELAQAKCLFVDFHNYKIELEKHQNLSRTASAGKFKGGLADNKEETTQLHTVAHLLLSSLKKVLSQEVEQKGANITEERLRFDFNWPEKLTPEQISEIENLVNSSIKRKLEVKMEEMSLDEAKKSGAHGTFLDRYGDRVKIYTIGNSSSPFSKEICGGPHIKNTSELGHFKIIKEESSSSGIRRIKAVLE